MIGKTVNNKDMDMDDARYRIKPYQQIASSCSGAIITSLTSKLTVPWLHTVQCSNIRFSLPLNENCFSLKQLAIRIASACLRLRVQSRKSQAQWNLDQFQFKNPICVAWYCVLLNVPRSVILNDPQLFGNVSFFFGFFIRYNSIGM